MQDICICSDVLNTDFSNNIGSLVLMALNDNHNNHILHTRTRLAKAA